MNIAFAKIGKSIKFKTAYSPVGGDVEAPSMIRLLANLNPDNTYWLIGRSDFSKLTDNERKTLFVYDNVKDAFQGIKPKDIVADTDTLNKWYEKQDFKFDFGIMMIGQIGTVTIPGKTQQVKKRHLTASVIEMTKGYSTNPINFLNTQKDLKWIEIINDPRYTAAQARDFISRPTLSLGQYDYKYHNKKIKSFEDQDTHEYDNDVSYSSMELISCYDVNEKPDLKELSKNKDILFNVILNEGAPSRYKFVKEWLIDNLDIDVNIYGRWNDSCTEDSFKGSIQYYDVNKIMKRTKYTFIIPIAAGWATSKYIEMIMAGCIPFFHPDYDSQGNIDIPKDLRVKTPKELKLKIKFLEEHPNVYIKLINQLQDMLDDSLFNGHLINDTVMESGCSIIGDKYSRPDLSEWSVADTNDLSNFF